MAEIAKVLEYIVKFLSRSFIKIPSITAGRTLQGEENAFLLAENYSLPKIEEIAAVSRLLWIGYELMRSVVVVKSGPDPVRDRYATVAV